MVKSCRSRRLIYLIHFMYKSLIQYNAGWLSSYPVIKVTVVNRYTCKIIKVYQLHYILIKVFLFQYTCFFFHVIFSQYTQTIRKDIILVKNGPGNRGH